MASRINLVTGATGFSGSYVVGELLKAGEQVVGTDLARNLENTEHMAVIRDTAFDPDHPNLELVAADLLDPPSLERLVERKPNRVFHTASLYDYSAPMERLERINITGTRNLLEVTRGLELERFIHWSTCGVFGKPYTAADGKRVNVPFTEESPSPRNTPDDAIEPTGTHLVNAYSVTKWRQEKMMWAAHRNEGLPLTVIRPAPIYGPGSSYGHGGIILTIAHGLLPVIPLDARNYVTTSVHVRDVARFACFIADQENAVGQDYNVVDNSIISYYEFLRYIGLLTGRKMLDLPLVNLKTVRHPFIVAAKTWTWLEQSLGVPRVRVFEVQSATYVSSSYWLSNRKTLAAGFEYLYPDVREGLKDTIAWFKDAGWLTDRRRLFAG